MFDFDELNFKIEKELDISAWERQVVDGIGFRFAGDNRLSIRSMALSDIPEIVEIEKLAFADPWTEESFLYDLLYPYKKLAITGLLRDNIVAYLLSVFIADELHLHNIAVHPEYQGQGIAKLMLWYMLSVAQYERVGVCHLEVRVSNQNAIELYKKFGFEILGQRRGYYQNNKEDALLMSKKIFNEWET
ncbi:ribosomal protein S18-alanine N-acetyltransferase [candidate division KSB1 bacterium]|nr:ribosomal protein S18-alanine N-acetyltransferase [candidate division KSB1 bacterium]